MKENLKPFVYRRREIEESIDRVLFVERSGELQGIARLSAKKARSRRETECEKREKLCIADPKPGDLSMPRLKCP